MNIVWPITTLVFSMLSYFSKFLRAFSPSRICVISHRLGEHFKLMVSRLLENAFTSQKIESRHIYLCPHADFSSGSYYHHPDKGKLLTFLLGSNFLTIFLGRQVETMRDKELKLKRWTIFYLHIQNEQNTINKFLSLITLYSHIGKFLICQFNIAHDIKFHVGM